MQEISTHVLAFFRSVNWGEIAHCIFVNKYFWIAVSVLVLVRILINILKPKFLRVKKSDSGEIVLSSSAIKEIVENVCADIETAIKPRVKIISRGKKFQLNVRVKIAFGTKISDVTSELQKKLIQTFVNDMGIDSVFSVDITVVGFLSNKCAQKVLQFYRKKYGFNKVCASDEL